MCKFFVLLLLPLLSFFPKDDCGSYRWDYKILVDTAGLRIFNMNPHPGRIEDLVRLARPHAEAMEHQRAELEKQQVTVTAYVIAVGREDDRDYHLVLESPANSKTLIGEIPDPDCSKLKKFPELRRKYQDARDFVRKQVEGNPEAVAPLRIPVKVKVTGVVFFDKLSHGNYHADNGVEIHPILKISRAG